MAVNSTLRYKICEACQQSFPPPDYKVSTSRWDETRFCSLPCANTRNIVRIYDDNGILTGKSCSTCNDVKPVAEFHKDKTVPSTGLKSRCIDCERKRDKERYDADPAHFRDKTRRSRYRFAHGEFEQLVESQNGQCAICGKYKGNKLVVDHCHTTKKIRGLLCQGCNAALGKFQDSLEILTSASIYLVQNEDVLMNLSKGIYH